MPRSSGTIVENQFNKGLITETTALRFPPNACTEVFDCVFDSTGVVTRRLAFDYEDNYVLNTITQETGEVYTEFLWNAVAGDGLLGFVIQQQGSTIRFFDVSDSLDLSANLKSFTVDLNSYIPTDSNKDPAIYQCSYAQGNGDLIIANPAIDPIYISYDQIADTITVTSILIQYRDFEGLDDGLDLQERPTATVAGLKVSNPEHFYNIINQGWWTGYNVGGTAQPLNQWDSQRTDMPSNTDMPSYFRSTVNSAFDNLVLQSKTPGTSPATKGHFILSTPNPSRQDALDDEGFTGVTISNDSPLISPGEGAIIGDFSVGQSSRAFNGVTNQNDANSATKSGGPTDAYIGKDFSSAPFQIVSATIYGSNNDGFWDTDNGNNTTITLYGKNGSAPSTGTDGTSLGTVVFLEGANESAGRSITSSDQVTFWDYVWVRIARTGANTNIFIAEVQFYSTVPNTYERPKCVAFYSSRTFWGGIAKQSISNTIYFSPIIERQEQYGQCYQVNDPTSEDLSELLSSDGGVIKIPEMGNLHRLFVARNSLLALANNGVWLISGTSGSPFKATEYVIKRISSIGMTSPMSVVDLNGLPVWWGEDGIYTVQYDPNYDSFQLISLTVPTIDGFFNEIPSLNRNYAKGATDSLNKVTYWIYNSDESLASTDYYKYDRVLVFDAVSQAFYPWTISNGTPDVVGILYAMDSSRQTPGKIKYTTLLSTPTLTYSEANNPSYLDWETASDDLDYTSYFITGYRLEGQTQRYFQSNYIFVFLETEEDASCQVQSVFDFTNSGNSGKWSTPQEVYNSALTLRDVNHRRLKLRGKGRSLQLKFQSTTGNPFSIIGWSIWASSNVAL